MRNLLHLSLISLFGCCVAGQAPGFDPKVTFAPLTMPHAVNSYRSANGAPGPEYWQNRADYSLRAELDVAAKVLRVKETITYTNNSPDSLPSLWLQLDQNIYRKDSRASAMGGMRRRGGG